MGGWLLLPRCCGGLALGLVPPARVGKCDPGNMCRPRSWGIYDTSIMVLPTSEQFTGNLKVVFSKQMKKMTKSNVRFVYLGLTPRRHFQLPLCRFQRSIHS